MTRRTLALPVIKQNSGEKDHGEQDIFKKIPSRESAPVSKNVIFHCQARHAAQDNAMNPKGMRKSGHSNIKRKHLRHTDGQVGIVSLTLRVRSTSPLGSRLENGIPVSGVGVGGSRVDASFIRYSMFSRSP